MTIKGRGIALLATVAITAAVVLGSVSAASAQTDDYTPPSSVSNQSTQAQPTGQPLARTGSSNTIPTAEYGIALLMLGGVLVIIARKRSHRFRAVANN